MKKSLILLLAILTFGGQANAQKRAPYNYYHKGYWGNIEMAGGVSMGGGSDIGFSTTHGARLGNGIAMGLGIGYYLDVEGVVSTFYVPIFLETKYSPIKGGRSPYLSLRTGFSVNDWGRTGFYLAPALGFDVKRFSFFMRYGFNLYPMTADLDINSPDLDIELTLPAHLKSHTLSIGFAINF